MTDSPVASRSPVCKYKAKADADSKPVPNAVALVGMLLLRLLIHQRPACAQSRAAREAGSIRGHVDTQAVRYRDMPMEGLQILVMLLPTPFSSLLKLDSVRGQSGEVVADSHCLAP